jgi:hypothetical protein
MGGLLEGVVDMVGQVFSGLFGDIWRAATAWAREHPAGALALGLGWFGLGRMRMVAALLPRDLAKFAVILGPPLVIWALCRRTRSGRRGFMVALPVGAALLLVGMFWYAPDFRRDAIVWLALLAAAGLVTWFDHWLGGQPWTVAGVKAALARDDAREAFRAGVQAAAPGARVGKPVMSGGQIAVPVSTEAPSTLAQGVADGKVGATASAHGVPVSGVTVGASASAPQGQLMVRGTPAGMPHPLDGRFDYPDGGTT